MKLRLIILLILTAFSTNTFAQSSLGGIDGKIFDSKGQTVPFALVVAEQGGQQKGASKTDLNGNYNINRLNAGIYTIKVTQLGYNPLEVTNIEIKAGNSFTKNFKIAKPKGGTKLIKVIVKAEKDIIRRGEQKIQDISGDDVAKMATVNITDGLQTMSGVNSRQGSTNASIGGGRPDGTQYMLDGMLVSGAGISNIPPSALGGLQLFRSGIEAKYGNATGGLISLNTKGISRQGVRRIQAQTSVDGYFNNFANMYFSGPLAYKKKMKDGKKVKGRPVLGYILSLAGKYNKDANPAYGGYNVLKPEVLSAIQETPLATNPNGTGAATFISRAETVTNQDFRNMRARENGENYNFNYLGKLDFAPTAKMNVTLGTFFDYNRSKGWGFTNSIFAPEANSINKGYTARGFIRLQQSLGKENLDEKETPVFSKAFYTVQMSYQRAFGEAENPDHGRDVFQYGYLGKFDQQTTPIYRQDTVSGQNGSTYYGWRFIGDGFSDLNFTGAGINPLLENYTNQVMNDERFTIRNQTTMQAIGGLRNGDGPAAAYGLWTGPGAQISQFSYSQSDQFNLNLDASFNINQGVKNKANKDPIRHNIEFGMGYQQQTNRSYALAASGLWRQMRLLANRHIQTLDTDNPIFVVGGNEYTEDQLIASGLQFSQFDTVRFDRFYAAADQSRFDKELRKKLFGSETNTTQVFTDNLDPSTFSLDMFSADDLYNQGSGFVGYTGYDYLGNIERKQPNFNDFWTKKDERGDFLRPIAPYNPSYMFGYIQDKFKYKDILFNVGVRIDRFDANQNVLRDPYSLYGVRSLGSLNASDYRTAKNKTTNAQAPDPKAAGFDGSWVPYVDNNQSDQPTLVGYRQGDTWFDPFGKVVSDPTILSEEYASGLPIQPWLTDATDSIKSEGYKIDNAFTDYKPDITVSPRIQFTFPITDQAVFYGNYDIVTQTPSGANFVTPDDYYYFQERGATLNNANLQMERTINYTLGFDQAISKTSKIGIEVYYRERKDQIQLQQFILGYPQTYTSYGNRDFSTTKGFTFNYKMYPNQKSFLTMTMAYTLQFAEGTGSSATSMSSLIAQGQPNLRTIFPMSFDARHIANVNMNYTFPMNYTKGPKIGKNSYLLGGMGGNLTLNARSGEPYTRTAVATQLGAGGSNIPIIGGFNGSRRPWNTDVGLRIDKNFNLGRYGMKKDSEGNKFENSGRALGLNVYVYFQNLLNTRNVLGVYSYTGLADDDGFLASPQGQQQLNTAFIYPQSYSDLYTARINNPFNLNNPRRIFVGFSMNF